MIYLRQLEAIIGSENPSITTGCSDNGDNNDICCLVVLGRGNGGLQEFIVRGEIRVGGGQCKEVRCHP